MTYSLAELQAMPTISVGHFEDLKVETGQVRVWLSRMTAEDGADYDNEVIVEHWHQSGFWYTAKTYQAV
jgi:hypothetical protein